MSKKKISITTVILLAIDFILRVLVPGAIALVKTNWFAKKIKQSPNPDRVELEIAAFVIFALVVNYILSIFVPRKKLDAIKDGNEAKLRFLMKAFIGQVNNQGIEVKLNVMAEKTGFGVFWIAPKNNLLGRKIEWCPKIFAIKITEPSSHKKQMQKFRFKSDQGTSGEAFNSGRVVEKDLGGYKSNINQLAVELGLNKAQAQKTAELSFLISYPIQKLDASNAIVGVLTIEGYSGNTAELKDINNVDKSIESLIKSCALILF